MGINWFALSLAALIVAVITAVSAIFALWIVYCKTLENRKLGDSLILIPAFLIGLGVFYFIINEGVNP